MNKFYDVLKDLRIEKNVSRKALAEALNVTERLICYWENDKRECNFDMLIKIADYFDVSIDYLLGRKNY